jgi:putative transposase
MRYPDGGGLSAAGRACREAVRLQAAGLFAEDVDPVEVAWRLRVSAMSAYQWKGRWKAGGVAALAPTGPSGAYRRRGAGWGPAAARCQRGMGGGAAA